MTVQRMTELAGQFLLWGAFALLGLAVIEKIANVAGQTILRAAFRPSDLAEYGAILAVFSIALLLGGIRRELRGR